MRIDADDVVPWDETRTWSLRVIKALGSEFQLIRKPGVGHHPHGLDEPTPIAEFLFFNNLECE